MLVFVMVIIMVVMMVMFVLIMVVIIFVFGLRLLHEFLGPGGGTADLFEVELLGVEDILHLDLAVVRLDHLGFGLQRAYHRLHVLEVVLADGIDLVHDDGVAELDLLDKEVCDVLFFEVVRKELLAACEFVGEAGHVHHGNDVVEVAGEGTAVTAAQLLTGDADGLCDRHGFADTACLDEDVVELVHLEEFGNLFQEVGLEGAADAAIRKWHYLAGIFLRDVPALLDERLVDVHFADVVHDDGDVVTLLVVEHKVQEGRLSGSEVTGEQRDRYRFHFLILRMKVLLFKKAAGPGADDQIATARARS